MHGPELRSHPVGGHADDPDRPHREEGKGHVVVAAVDLETGRRLGHQVRGGGRMTRRVLERHDVGNLAGQPQHGHRLDPAAGANRNVIEHDGQLARGLGHDAEVLEDAGLRGPVVVRGHDQYAVEAALGGPARQADGVLRVVGPASRR